ncbi:diaminopimelate epimerase [Flavobacterium sp. JP2137]|uniref:diaminopimelate epimerase n=1 Tax=Flavobacterium sp. JP2137 TaxID=3414510 RepID=UPI003D2FC139
MDNTRHFYKYHGTGNDFIMIDNRDLCFPKDNHDLIAHWCNRRLGIGADGLILIEADSETDFGMVYYNSDGRPSSMCGNGGRCIVAFAKQLGMITDRCLFSAVDGLHRATIDAQGIVSLQMTAVDTVVDQGDSTFLNTGSPHHVQLVSDLAHCDVYTLGKQIRESPRYQPGGTNVNFVEKIDDTTFAIRTYERGVEAETWSCGTGATAVAIAMSHHLHTTASEVTILVKGGRLSVKFTKVGNAYTDVFLTGPATRVFDGLIALSI